MSKRRLKNSEDDVDDPPLSRLFIVCSKSTSEDDFRQAFEAFGDIEDIRILREREGESKGVAYIKFAKTSQAALACEAMNGQQIGNSQRPVKVIVAAR
jgi:RNA recognition motif-containing protein